MSGIKSLVPEGFDATEGHIDPFYYPGELESMPTLVADPITFDVNEIPREEIAAFTLKDYTIQEMEKELQERGYYIVTKDRYLEMVEQDCSE